MGVVAGGLALAASGSVLGASGPEVTEAPTITGMLQVGQTLTASGGSWTGPPGTMISYQWRRCASDCSPIAGAVAQTYKLVDADLGKWMQVELIASKGDRYDEAISDAAGPVAAAAPTPVPVLTPTHTPTATPTATATPAATATATPAPKFDVAAPAATPVPNAGAVLHETATRTRARMLRPRPVVRVRGRLTADGANVTLLTVMAPRGVKITVTCRGAGCPVRKMAKATRLTRLSTFQRAYRAGTRITVTVSKSGYASKVTVLRIRRGAPPLRTDGCVYPGHRKLQRCQY